MFLKIDIEDDEFKIIEEIMWVKNRIIGAVIEFHTAGTYYFEFKKLVLTLSEFMFLDHFQVNNCNGVSTSGFPEVVELSFSKRNLEVDRQLSTRLLLSEPDFVIQKNQRITLYFRQGFRGLQRVYLINDRFLSAYLAEVIGTVHQIN